MHSHASSHADSTLAHHFENYDQQREASFFGMWLFIAQEMLFFGGLFTAYLVYRIPNSFAFAVASSELDITLGAFNTVVLIASSLTMALAVNFGYRKNRKMTTVLLILTALLGATFVGMQAFEWSKLIEDGVRPWGNPMGAPQFGAAFFMITGFHGLHVSAGVIYLTVVAYRVGSGYYDRHRDGNYEMVEIAGLYWHFVDLVWVFIFAFFYLW